MEEKQTEKLSSPREYGTTRYTVTWTILILFGIVVEFVARLLGYADNPFAFYHPLIPAFTGISAALIILMGYFSLMSEKAKKSSMARRNGVMIIVLGSLMLICFFVFSKIIPMIF